MKLSQSILDLGFTKYEAQVYLALVKESPLNGSQLSRASGVPRANIYNVLDALKIKGIIISTGKKEFAPVPPDELIKNLRAQSENNLKTFKEVTDEIKTKGNEEYIWPILGYDNIITKALEMIAKAKYEVFIRFFPEESEILIPALKEAESRGADIKFISLGDIPIVFKYQIIHPEMDSLRRNIEGRSLNIVIDEREVITGHLTDRAMDKTRCSYAKNSSLAFLTREALRHDYYHLFFYKTYELGQELSENEKEIYQLLKKRFWSSIPENKNRTKPLQAEKRKKQKPTAKKKRCDLLIRGGIIIDGSGKPSFKGDVAVKEGKVVEVGQKIDLEAEKTIETKGAVVCPGFIDCHTHDDLYVISQPHAPAKIRQGVTTVVIGNCGLSVVPAVNERWGELKGLLGMLGIASVPEGLLAPMDFRGYLNVLSSVKPGINIVPLIGHTSLRLAVMGSVNRRPHSDEMAAMRNLLRQAMELGAFGMSTGLIYPPGSYSDTGELIDLCREITRHNGIYTTHLRSESAAVDQALKEALEIGEKSGVRLQLSHHKVAGKANWGRSRDTLAVIEAARKKGMEVFADQYPYDTSSTYLTATIPQEDQEGGLKVLCDNLKKHPFRERLRSRMLDGKGFVSSLGFNRILISNSPNRPDCMGHSIKEISERDQVDPVDVIFDILIADNAETSALYQSMSEDDVKRIMTRPYVMFGSDGMPALTDRELVHPRFFGTFPRILGHYARDLKLLSLEEAIRKMTSLPARVFHLKTKGLISKGMDADLVIFDPEKIIDRATFKQPNQSPEGIHKVILGGEIAVDSGNVTGLAKGGILRHDSVN